MRRDAAFGALLRLRCSPISHAYPSQLSGQRIPVPFRQQLKPLAIVPVLATPFRAQYGYSSVSAAAQRTNRQTTSAQPPIRKPAIRDSANPPASTRPPPLDLPTREPGTTLFQYLFSTGKAYLTFYKTGLRQIYTNYRLLYPSPSSPSKLTAANASSVAGVPSPRPPPVGSRAALLLRARWQHDVRRLPLFALLLLVCGEFTPFIVLALPSIVPYTCRIPKQAEKLQRAAEERQARALHSYRLKLAEPEPYVARALGVVSPLWERIGVTLPVAIVGGRVRRRLKALAEDDRLLIQAGGVEALEADEIKLACADRGIAVLGREQRVLKRVLERWLFLLGGPELGEEERMAKMIELLLSEEKEWPPV